VRIRIRTALRRAALIGCAAAAAAALAGCASYERQVRISDEDYGSRTAGDPKQQGSRMFGNTTGDARQHENKFLEYSALLSRELTTIPGVQSGLVILTDKNAYAAISLQRASLGTSRGRMEQDEGGTDEGVYNHDTGSPHWDGNKLVTPYNSPLTVNDHSLLSGELKQAIAMRIRTLAPRVEEVHVSANMDFVNEMLEYAKEAWAGRPLQPWLGEFNTLVSYHFADGRTMPVPMQQLRQARDREESLAAGRRR